MVLARKALFTVALFPRKSIVIVVWDIKGPISMIFFSDSSARNLFFTWESVCFHFMDCFSANILAICKHFFNKSMLLRIHHTFISKFHMVCTSQPPKISLETSVQSWGTVNAEFTFIKKNFEKNNFFLNPSLFFIEWQKNRHEVNESMDSYQ